MRGLQAPQPPRILVRVVSRKPTGRTRGIGHAERAPQVLRLLTRAGSRGLSKAAIVEALGATSSVSVQRTLKMLRDERDAKIEYVLATKRWRLISPFAMPLEDPEEDDVVAVLAAKEILTPIVDREFVERLGRVAEDLDDKRIARAGSNAVAVTARIGATVTFGTRSRPGVLSTLQRACRRCAVRIDYVSPWKPVALGRRSYEVEPWAVRFHDGAAYVRVWRRDIREPRTLRVAQIQSVERLAIPRKQLARVPRPEALWGNEDPAFGIDLDRPDEAVIVLEGPVARWLHPIEWHPSQVDRWIVEDEVLERRLRYRSCREIARRIVSVYDAVCSIEPAALRDEVARIRAGRPTATLPGVMQRVPPEAARAAEPMAPRPAKKVGRDIDD